MKSSWDFEVADRAELAAIVTTDLKDGTTVLVRSIECVFELTREPLLPPIEPTDHRPVWILKRHDEGG